MPRNFLFSWRLWLALLALLMMQFVLYEAVGLGQWVVLAMNVVVGGWLGILAGRADNEEQLEARERAHARWRARWDHAVREGLGLEPDYGDRT